MDTPLRKMREKLGITITELSRAVDIDVGNLSRIERGMQQVSLVRAETIAKYFSNEISVMEIIYPQKYQASIDDSDTRPQ